METSVATPLANQMILLVDNRMLERITYQAFPHREWRSAGTCILYPLLFSAYTEQVLTRETEITESGTVIGEDVSQIYGAQMT